MFLGFNQIYSCVPTCIRDCILTYCLMICLWCLTFVRAMYFSCAFPFSSSAVCFLSSRVLLFGFLQLAPLQEMMSSVFMIWLGAHIQPELYSDLLQGSCLFLLLLFFNLYPFRDLFMIMSPSVTYIHQGRISLLCHFLLWLTPI